MDEQDWLAERFEEKRDHLRAVAYRMLGSASEADDAVQEAWLRLSRTDAGEVNNLGGWLTTVIGRVCLDMLRSRSSRREESLDGHLPDAFASDEHDPEQGALLADAVGPALLVVLEMLTPAERLSFVLHDLFGVPFDEIATIVGRSPQATRQLASRARRRVQGGRPASDVDRHRQREIVEAFLAASRGGDFDALLGLLDPNVVVRPDDAALEMGTQSGWMTSPLHGARAVAGQFNGRAQAARLALIDGQPGAVWVAGGRPRVVFRFTIADGRIAAIELLGNPDRIAALDVKIVRRNRAKRPAPDDR